MIGPFGLVAVGIALFVWIVWPDTEPPAPPVYVRILSGAHRDHFGELARVTPQGRALVRLRTGVCVWVPANEWVRIGP